MVNQKQQGSNLGTTNYGTSSVSSENDLQGKIMSALSSDSGIDATNITIRMRENDMVEICGFVPRESMVILAEECVRRVEGVKGEIDNDLKVRAN